MTCAYTVIHTSVKLNNALRAKQRHVAALVNDIIKILIFWLTNGSTMRHTVQSMKHGYFPTPTRLTFYILNIPDVHVFDVRVGVSVL